MSQSSSLSPFQSQVLQYQPPTPPCLAHRRHFWCQLRLTQPEPPSGLTTPCPRDQARGSVIPTSRRTPGDRSGSQTQRRGANCHVHVLQAQRRRVPVQESRKAVPSCILSCFLPEGGTFIGDRRRERSRRLVSAHCRKDSCFEKHGGSLSGSKHLEAERMSSSLSQPRTPSPRSSPIPQRPDSSSSVRLLAQQLWQLRLDENPGI